MVCWRRVFGVVVAYWWRVDGRLVVRWWWWRLCDCGWLGVDECPVCVCVSRLSCVRRRVLAVCVVLVGRLSWVGSYYGVCLYRECVCGGLRLCDAVCMC